MKALTIRIGYVDSAGVFQPWANKAVYLRPVDMNVTYLNGSTYYAWNKNQNGDVGYESFWKAVTSGTGYATFAMVPFTDTEMHRPKDPSGNPIGPPPQWELVNPWAANGPVVYRGQLLSTMTLGATVNVPDELTQLAADAWSVSNFQASAGALGGKVQSLRIPFAVGVEAVAASFPVAFSGPPNVFVSGEYDKDGNFSAPAVKQDGAGEPIVSSSAATIQIAPGMTSTVYINVLAIGN